MRNYLLAGLIKNAKAVTRTNKQTKQSVTHTELTVEYEDFDKNGELVLDVDHIQLDISELDSLKSARGKFIVIPYIYINTPGGTWLIPDENMQYTIFEKSPFMQEKK
jgi:hypothetical protein